MRTTEITLEFQDYIDAPPVAPSQLYSQACANDEVTIASWRATWIKQIKANHKTHGPFHSRGVGQFFGRYENRPAIVVGSGPSLRYNAHELKQKGDIPVISCLHNFHFLEDLGVDVDFYVSLDAGPVTIEEVAEGGGKSPEEYWAMTKGKKLCAYIGTHPELLAKWQGEIYFFNAPVPDPAFDKEIDAVEKFNTYLSTGGNVLGACLYLAKGIMGANPICFMGADFSFSYQKKFHAWDSKYDTSLGYVLRVTDVYGNKVSSWQSYLNFKAWFEAFACRVPGSYFNATEGGCLGSYPEGNIRQITQVTLKGFLETYQMHRHLKDQCERPGEAERKILF